MERYNCVIAEYTGWFVKAIENIAKYEYEI